MKWVLSFKATEELVDTFARTTGDFNNLHMNSQEARTSAYHQRLVHGMLPVSALGLLEPLTDPSKEISIRQIAGRFIYPVYIGDTLTVELCKEPENNLAALQQRFTFNIYSSSMQQAVTFGTVVLQYAPRKNPFMASHAVSDGSFVREILQENTLELEEMKKGLTETFTFDTIPQRQAAWLKSLKKHLIEKPAGDNSCCLFENIAVMLCSTMVGMRLPGRRATFLDFSLEFIKPLKPDACYTFKSTIEFISMASRIVVEKINIFQTPKNENAAAQGKMTVKIDEPTKELPDFKQLNQYALDHSLKGKVVIITGASRGIGATTARLFACHGARVVVNYLASAAQAKQVVDDIISNGGEALAIQADVRDQTQVKSMILKTVETFGGIDILVNNAVSDFLSMGFGQLSWEKIQYDIDVIVKGAFYCCQEAVPFMIKKGSGRIINVGTVATEVPPAGHMKYVIAKSALVGLNRSLAVELAGHNILVNMVMPGMVETDLTKTVPPMLRDNIRKNNPLKRHPTTIDVAMAIISLAGPSSSYTTGQKLFVTGGLPPFI